MVGGWGERLGEAQSSSHYNQWTEANRGPIFTHASTYQDRIQKKGGWSNESGPYIFCLEMISITLAPISLAKSQGHA